MNFNESYNFLLNRLPKDKILTIAELDNITSETEYFDDIDLTDCIYNNKCTVNSYSNDEQTKVINIDIEFINKNDINTIKNMTWEDEKEYNDIKIKIENISLYNNLGGYKNEK